MKKILAMIVCLMVLGCGSAKVETDAGSTDSVVPVATVTDVVKPTDSVPVPTDSVVVDTDLDLLLAPTQSIPTTDVKTPTDEI